MFRVESTLVRTDADAADSTIYSVQCYTIQYYTIQCYTILYSTSVAGGDSVPAQRTVTLCSTSGEQVHQGVWIGPLDRTVKLPHDINLG